MAPGPARTRMAMAAATARHRARPVRPRFESPAPSAARRSAGGDCAGLQPAGDPAPAQRAAPAVPGLVISRFEDLIALAAEKRDISVKLALERDLRLVRCEDGRLEVALEPSAAKTLVNDLAPQVFASGPAGAGWSWSRRSRRSRP